MMGKIRSGSSFGGCVKYAATKKDAELIGAMGVELKNWRTIAESMELQSQMNPRLGKKVGHISLNFSVQDKDRLTNEYMVKVANEYMYKMGIRDTQAVVYRHYDREHPHCHIVYNRVSNSGKTISDKKERIRNMKICRQLTEAHGLYLKKTDAKQNVKQDRLIGRDKIKYEIYHAIKDGLQMAKSWPELKSYLHKQGITTDFKTKGKTDVVQGVVFTKGNQKPFNGSEIDRQFSYSKLSALLNENAKQHNQTGTVSVQTEQSQRQVIKPVQNPTEHTYPKPQFTHEHSAGSGLAGLFNIHPSGDSYDEGAAELERELKKRKKKKRGRSI
ncbi:MAG: relaxase/mobilization nuclease domain-containing protein [Alistipes sp.]|nr:relaxase/mobilization nuclease domain-containing protein [Alistipes sp.]